jgi:transcriptional regulator with XRE-family HTH domain
MMLPGLKFERHVAGLTQEKRAERSGVHRDTIQKLEIGQRPALPATIKRLSEILGMDPRRLLSSP